MTKLEMKQVKELALRVACEAYIDNIDFTHGPIFLDGMDGAIFDHTPKQDEDTMQYWTRRINHLVEYVGLEVTED